LTLIQSAPSVLPDGDTSTWVTLKRLVLSTLEFGVDLLLEP
jgi:hypothetical protein